MKTWPQAHCRCAGARALGTPTWSGDPRYMAVGATDLRKGFEELLGLVKDRLGLEPLSEQCTPSKGEMIGHPGGR
jgi:hypothetical protein